MHSEAITGKLSWKQAYTCAQIRSQPHAQMSDLEGEAKTIRQEVK